MCYGAVEVTAYCATMREEHQADCDIDLACRAEPAFSPPVT